MIIAIDGPAASGKGSIARRIAAHYGLPHLDTGLLYRATAAALIAEDRDLYDEAAAVAAARGLGLTDFNDATLRTRQMGEAASVVAAMPGVRAALIEAQRAFAARPGGAVLDGRDIGTVICPDADVKIFVTASATARAQRRALELIQRGEKADYKRDSGRHHPPRRARFRARRRAVAPGRRRHPTRHDPSRRRSRLRRGAADRRSRADQGVRRVPRRRPCVDPADSGGGALGKAALRRAQPLDGAVDFAALPLQMADLGVDLLRIELILEVRRFGRPLAADQVLDFCQGEAELLALQNHFHANAVGSAVVAGVALPARLDEAAILIEAQRAQADAECARHLTDGHLRLRRVMRSVALFSERRARSRGG